MLLKITKLGIGGKKKIINRRQGKIGFGDNLI
jgi:hypothetical protein